MHHLQEHTRRVLARTLCLPLFGSVFNKLRHINIAPVQCVLPWREPAPGHMLLSKCANGQPPTPNAPVCGGELQRVPIEVLRSVLQCNVSL